jgi:hypothetical protein
MDIVTATQVVNNILTPLFAAGAFGVALISLIRSSQDTDKKNCQVGNYSFIL